VTAALFAHQGGWDEILFVAVPIAIFAGLLAVANRRASKIEDARNSKGGGRTERGGGGDERPGRSAG
jgi:hypothetical protein